MRPRPKSRAYTLLEIVLSAFLFLLVSGILFRVFHQMTVWKLGEEQRRQEQAGNLVAASRLGKILVEMPGATLSALYPSNTPAQGDLVLCGATSRASDGTWMETDLVPNDAFYQIIYLDQVASQLKSIHLPSPGTPPITMALDPTLFAPHLSVSPDRVLAKGLEKFQLLDPLSGAVTDKVTSPLRFRVVQQGPGGEDSRAVQRTVHFAR